MDDTREQVSTFKAGDIIEGKYRIQRLLDEGGMGSVYHAIQEPLGRDVAIKVLKPREETPEKREHRYKRFFREAQVCSKLAHPNTIVILDYGELSDRAGFFFVMEFLEGRSLRQLLMERGSLGLRLTLHLAMQIASSVADAHRHGVIHRDLKPPNVMLVRRGDDPYFVKVVDFGLVKEMAPDEGAEELTSDNALIGSPMYMAPERFVQVKADSPSLDVYALGIMIYEMLVGRPPFVRDADSTLHHIMLQHIQVEPPPMRSFRPDLELPEGLEPLVMRCLEKDPHDRIGSMETLLNLLRACAAGAGMGVNAPVEDTGIFPGLPQLRAETSSDALGIEETGDSEFQTVEEPRRGSATVTANTASPTRPGLATLVALFALVVTAAIVGLAVLPAPAEPTRLVVRSEPAGATVLLDGEPIGTTPFETPIEAQNGATLTFRKSGFLEYHSRIPANAGSEFEVQAPLEPEPVPEETQPEPTAEPDPPPTTEEPAADEEPASPEEPVKTTKKKRKPKPRQDPKPNVDIKLDR